MCGDRDIADDLFQETVIKIWNGLKHYREQQKFSSWIFTLAHNVTIDYRRKNKITEVDIEEVEIESSENVFESIELKEAGKIVAGLLKNVPEKQKRVFLLRQHSDMSFKEIAELTNEPLNTVISQMNYAVKKIRKQLKGSYGPGK